MTPQEAIEILEAAKVDYVGIINSAIDLATEATEKKIPKKIVKIDKKVVSILKNKRTEEEYTEYRCPECGNWITNIPKRILYCDKCGQALDWEDKE